MFYFLTGGLVAAAGVQLLGILTASPGINVVACVEDLGCAVQGPVWAQACRPVAAEWWWMTPTLFVAAMTTMVALAPLSPVDSLNIFFDDPRKRIVAAVVAIVDFVCLLANMWIAQTYQLPVAFTMPFFLHLIFLLASQLLIIVIKILPKQRVSTTPGTQ